MTCQPYLQMNSNKSVTKLYYQFIYNESSLYCRFKISGMSWDHSEMSIRHYYQSTRCHDWIHVFTKMRWYLLCMYYMWKMMGSLLYCSCILWHRHAIDTKWIKKNTARREQGSVTFWSPTIKVTQIDGFWSATIFEVTS